MCDEKPDKKSAFLNCPVFRWMSDVKAPVGGEGLRRSSSSVELANGGDPVTDMLSFSNPSSTLLLLLSLSSVWVGVNCDEFVNEMLFGEPFGLVVLCGLHTEF